MGAGAAGTAAPDAQAGSLLGGIQTPAQSKNLATAAKILAYTGARVNEIM